MSSHQKLAGACLFSAIVAGSAVIASMLFGSSSIRAAERQSYDTHPPSQRASSSAELSTRFTVPFVVENGQIIVNVRLNDQGVFPMIFDTGGLEAVTPEVALALGVDTNGTGSLRGAGEGAVPVSYAVLKDIRLGEAALEDLQVPVVALPRFFVDRGTQPPLAGFLGFELLSRFAVRLDYGRKTLTLTPTAQFRYSGPGQRVALSFADNAPVIAALADGIAGQFEIDLGSSDAIVLQGSFADRTGLAVRHPGTLRMKVGGVDGVFDIAVTRLNYLRIGPSAIERPAAQLPLNGRSGLPVASVDGSIGYQILRQFTVTFDYARREAWFERSTDFGAQTVVWKTGFQAAKTDAGFRVINVAPNTPAAEAGMSVGDVITAVEAARPRPLARPSSPN